MQLFVFVVFKDAIFRGGGASEVDAPQTNAMRPRVVVPE